MRSFWIVLLGVFAMGMSSCSSAAKKEAIQEPATESAQTQLEANKKTVVAFYELAFNGHQPEEAVQLYVGPEYTQHNPYAANGSKAFVDFFKPYFKKHSKTSVSIKRVMADGDLVMVHVHSKQNPKDRGQAVVDIFRLENGKIVEHWDVVQDIPAKSANQNTMF